MNWILVSIICILSWGVWGIFSKVALNHLGWRLVFVVANGIGYPLLSLAVYFLNRPSFAEMGRMGLMYAFATGITGGIGALTFFLALEKGPASVVVPLTSLYPALTVILALLLLRESINLTQMIGVVLALIAIVLISISS